MYMPLPPDSCKCQGSNADQLKKTKRTRRKTNEASNDDNLNKSEDELEAVDGVEDEDMDDPPALRSGK